MKINIVTDEYTYKFEEGILDLIGFISDYEDELAEGAETSYLIMLEDYMRLHLGKEVATAIDRGGLDTLLTLLEGRLIRDYHLPSLLLVQSALSVDSDLFLELFFNMSLNKRSRAGMYGDRLVMITLSDIDDIHSTLRDKRQLVDGLSPYSIISLFPPSSCVIGYTSRDGAHGIFDMIQYRGFPDMLRYEIVVSKICELDMAKCLTPPYKEESKLSYTYRNPLKHYKDILLSFDIIRMLNDRRTSISHYDTSIFTIYNLETNLHKMLSSGCQLPSDILKALVERSPEKLSIDSFFISNPSEDLIKTYGTYIFFLPLEDIKELYSKSRREMKVDTMEDIVDSYMNLTTQYLHS